MVPGNLQNTVIPRRVAVARSGCMSFTTFLGAPGHRPRPMSIPRGSRMLWRSGSSMGGSPAPRGGILRMMRGGGDCRLADPRAAASSPRGRDRGLFAHGTREPERSPLSPSVLCHPDARGRSGVLARYLRPRPGCGERRQDGRRCWRPVSTGGYPPGMTGDVEFRMPGAAGIPAWLARDHAANGA